jgi:hypothetical protein
MYRRKFDRLKSRKSAFAKAEERFFFFARIRDRSENTGDTFFYFFFL